MKKATKLMIRSLVASASLLSVVGCASLTNPYVNMSDYSGVPKVHPESGGNSGNSATAAVCKSPPDCMAQAVQCAEVIRSTYLDAMGDQAQLAAWTGIGLIPLTAFTTYVAIDGGNASQVTSLALTAAAGFALSNWLSQPERTKIYGLGQEALQCAISAAQPFNLGTKEINDIDGRIVHLRTSIGLVSGAILNVDAALAGTNNADTDATRYAKSLVASARQRVTEGEALANTATSMIASYDRAPGQLLSTVGEINAAVNKALASTIQSLSTLPGVLSGMNAMYETSAARFAGLAPGDAVAVGDEAIQLQALKIDAKQSLHTAVEALKSALKVLFEATAKVKNDVQRRSPGAPSPALQSCGIDTSKIADALVLSSAALSFKVGDKDRKSFTATGGSGSYVYVADENQFDVRQIPAFGGNFSVGLDGEQPGSYIITIKDVNGRSSDIAVTVAAGLQTSGKQDQTSKADLCTQEDSLTAPEEVICKEDKEFRETVQRVLKKEFNIEDDAEAPFVDGIYGQKTREKLNEFISKYSTGDDFDVTAALRALDYQQGLSAEALQAIVGFIKGTHADGADDRASIMAFQAANGVTSPHGFVDEDTAKKACAGRDNDECKNLFPE